MNGIEIRIDSKTYPGRGRAQAHTAIANLRLQLAQNEFVCLVGPSGCGKTTLLNLIAGLDRDFQGRITFPHPQPPVVGYVFQEPRLLPWRTVRENLELALPPGRDTGVIDELLEITQLTAFQHTHPQRLSLGMCRRVALARAFATDPDLLLMDEPFVSLDAPTAEKMRQLVTDLWLRRPHTVLFVTHDLREALALADRIVFLTPPPARVAREFTIVQPRHQRNAEFIEPLYRQLNAR